MCSFFVPSLTYLGHTIDSHGIHTLSDRVEAVMKVPIPTNVSQLRSFLGTMNYYGLFIPQLSSKLAPLNNLLRSDGDGHGHQKLIKHLRILNIVYVSHQYQLIMTHLYH